jgi:hypothetical protein
MNRRSNAWCISGTGNSIHGLEMHRTLTSEVPTAVDMKTTVFWAVTPCSLVESYQCLEGTCCLHICLNSYTLKMEPAGFSETLVALAHARRLSSSL